MRKEYTSFNSALPVKIFYSSVKEYPLHWHNCIEIIYVLKGQIKLSINTDNFEISENQLEIINIDEAHSISSR